MSHTCKLKDLSCSVFQQILDYIYTSELVLCEENIQDILQASDLLLMDSLKSLCCDYLEQCITTSNCIGIRDFSECFSCPRVHHVVSTFIDEHFIDVSFSEEFLQLSVTKIRDLLSRNSLMILGEDSIFDCIRRWVNHSVEDRELELPGLLKDCVNIGLMDDRFVHEQVMTDPLIRKLHLEVNVLEMRKSQLSQVAQQRGYCSMVVVTGGEGPSESDNRIIEIKNSAKCMCIEQNSHPSVCTWLQLADMNENRNGHGMVDAGGYLYAVGGRDNSGRILNSGEKYNPLTNTWTSIPPMSHARVGFGLVNIDDKVYAIGGSNDMSDPITSVEEFDIYTNKWRPLPDMNLKRAWSAYAVCNKKIYVIGGGVMGKLYEAVECLDPKSQTWMSMTPMKERRFDARAVGLGSDVYVFGGLRRLECPSVMHNMSGMKFCSTEVFNTDTKTWGLCGNSQRMCTMKETSRIDAALVYRDEILIIGSLDMQNEYHCIRAFHPPTTRWRCVAQNHPPYQKGMQAAMLRMPRSAVYQLMWTQNKLTFDMMKSFSTRKNESD